MYELISSCAHIKRETKNLFRTCSASGVRLANCLFEPILLNDSVELIHKALVAYSVFLYFAYYWLYEKGQFKSKTNKATIKISSIIFH